MVFINLGFVDCKCILKKINFPGTYFYGHSRMGCEYEFITIFMDCNYYFRNIF